MSRAGQLLTDSAPLSPALQQALQASMRRSERLYGHLPTSYPGSLRIEYATRWLLMALDHREAFLCLVAHNRVSSAYALMRPMYETLWRGFWASNVATDAQLEGIKARRAVPKMETISKELNAHLDSHASQAEDARHRGAFARSKLLAWPTLSDFAHGGMLQLGRWADSEGTIGPSHGEDEVKAMLLIADGWAVVTCSVLFETAALPVAQDVLDVLQEVIADHEDSRAHARAAASGARTGA